jgi:hypothetical protein
VVSRDHVKAPLAELPIEILPEGQSKCHRDTDMCRFDNPAHHAGYSTQNRDKMGRLRHDIRDMLTFDCLHGPAQIP